MIRGHKAPLPALDQELAEARAEELPERAPKCGAASCYACAAGERTLPCAVCGWIHLRIAGGTSWCPMCGDLCRQPQQDRSEPKVRP